MNSSQDNPAFVLEEDGPNSNSTTMQDTKNLKKDIFSLDIKYPNNSIPEEDYDPFKNRKVDHPTTNLDTIIHLLKGSLGTGILAMPMAFYHSGYIVGLICTLLIGSICTYCIHLLIKAEYELCKRRKEPSLTYPATAEAAFAEGPPFFKKFSPYSVHVVNTFLLTYQIGTCCVYVVFIASNIKSIFDFYDMNIDITYYMLILLLPLIFINWIRNLKLLAPLSTLANIITFVSFGIILYYIISDGPTFTNRDAVGKIEDFPLYFGTVLFALEAIGVIMPLENEMKTPKSFGGTFGVLNLGMGTIIFLYVGMGLLGYLTYGSESLGSITLNIPDGQILAQVVKGTLAVAIYISYSLQCYVAVDIAWNEYILKKMEKNKMKLFWEYVVRTVIVLITVALAAAVPKLDLFISLFGALCLSALGIAFPAIIDMSTYWYTFSGSRSHLNIVKNILLVLFGFTGLIVGTYTSLSKIIEEFL